MTGNAATTLGELRESGWESLPVKEEMRRNLLRRLEASDPLFEGVFGYDDTVLPAVQNAVLAGHDIIFLGERGQAKSRIIRSLVNLLDPELPVIAGSEINDDPFDPVSAYAKELVAEKGDETPIDWLPRDRRYGEKLATPDISIADLIGEVDPIKVAEGRYLSDELTLHYGLIPRTHRGIFAINELPDLAERIQVGLLNILEERDVQIRGYKIRLPIDVFLMASANPEDYTNRGRIITPLKDRFGSQIRTHYPLETDLEMEIVHAERRPLSTGSRFLRVPNFMDRIIAEISQLARSNPSVNQRSGVSVRMTIANQESLEANALRRSVRCGETEVVPRVSDLGALVPSTAGKIEIESFDDGRESELFEKLVAKAILAVYRMTVSAEDVRPLLDAVNKGELSIEVDALMPAKSLVDQVAGVPGFPEVLSRIGGESPGSAASALELILEGLHLSKRLNKSGVEGKLSYSSQ